MLATPVWRTTQTRKTTPRPLRDVIGLPFFHSVCSENVGSIPTPLESASKHLVVDVGASVTQDLVKFVPIALASGVRQIDTPVDDLFAVTACGPGNGQPVQFTMTLCPSKGWSRSVPTRSAQAMKREFECAAAWCKMLAIAGGPRFLAGDRHPVGRDADHVGALQRLQPKVSGNHPS